MQSQLITDLNTPAVSNNLGKNLTQSNENQSDFSDLLQGTIQESEQRKGSLISEERHEVASEAKETASDTHFSKKDTHPTEAIKEDTHFSKKDTHPTETRKEDAHLSKKDTHPTEVTKEDTHFSKTDIQLESLQAKKLDKQLSDQLMTQTKLSNQKSDAKETSNTVLTDLLQPLMTTQATQTNSEKEQTIVQKNKGDLTNTIDPIIAFGLVTQIPEKLEDITKRLEADDKSGMDELPLQVSTDNKATQLEQAMLDKLQALLGQEKGLELANALENELTLEPFKDQFAKIDNLKSFNQLVDGLSDSGNKNVQQALQSILGVHKAQDSNLLSSTTYKFEMQGKVSQQVNDKILWMTQQDIKQARLVLDPSNLGNIDIHIAMHKNEATVHFLSSNQWVKEAIEANMNQLSAQMAQDGLTLMQSNVQMQQQGRQAFGYEANPHASAPFENSEELIGPSRTSRPQDGMLHLYI